MDIEGSDQPLGEAGAARFPEFLLIGIRRKQSREPEGIHPSPVADPDRAGPQQ